MTNSLRFTATGNVLPGYAPPDDNCSRVLGEAMCMSQYSSPCHHKSISDIKLSVKCASRHTSSVFDNTFRRNPDFSRQNKQGLSRNRNDRDKEDKDGHKGFEETSTFSGKTGPVHSFSGNQQKFQVTSTLGPREKEIVELFRKVQSQLRERAAKKEDRKVEGSQGKRNDNKNVDSLLNLLRKHSVKQEKKITNSVNSGNFVLGDSDRVETFINKRRSNVLDSVSSVKHQIEETEFPSPYLSRPKSNFQKRSPVPEYKFQPVYTEDSVNSVHVRSLDDGINGSKLERDIFNKALENQVSEVHNEHDITKEQDLAEVTDLSAMKLAELRALAKSHGMKGFSKLKKNELVDLLSDSSI